MAESAQIRSTSKPWHEALAEYFILYPQKSMAEAAKHFEVTLPWLSVVKNSDAFQNYYQARRREHFNDVSLALADSKIEDKLKSVADLALDGIAEKLADHTQESGKPKLAQDTTKVLSMDALQASAALALKSLGFGAKPAVPTGPTSIQHNTIIVGNADALARARGNLRVVREKIIDPMLESARAEVPALDNPGDASGPLSGEDRERSESVAVPAAA